MNAPPPPLTPEAVINEIDARLNKNSVRSGVDIDSQLNKNVINNKDKDTGSGSGSGSGSDYGGRRSKKRPTARRLRSSKARKARKARATRRR